MMISASSRGLFATGAVCLSMTTPLLAAEPAAPGQANVSVLEEVIVTAQRRAERLQDVPIAVTAADAEALAGQRVFNIENITSVSPSITFRSGNLASSTANIQIRGIGTTGNARSFEGSVGVFVDGIYRTRSGQALNNFLDIDNLQILRGPQGTLFGKNTSAGALLLTSAAPSTDAVAGDYEISYGNYEAYRIKGAVNVPLSSTVAIRLAALQTDHNGYVTNLNGGNANEQKDQAFKAQLLFAPGDDFKLRFIGDYAKGSGNCCFGTVRVTNGPVTTFLIDPLSLANGKAIPPTGLDHYQASLSNPTDTEVKDYGGTVLIDATVGAGKLSSITALRKYDVVQLQDADFSGADILNLRETFGSRFLSQELDYSGHADAANADYIFGAFFSDEKIDIDRAAYHGTEAQPFWTAVLAGAGVPGSLLPLIDAAPGLLNVEKMNEKVRSYALFTHWDFKIAEQWNVIAGVRGSREIKQGGVKLLYVRDAVFDPFAFLNLSPPIPYQAKSTDNAVSGTLGLQYHINQDAMLYATYNRGFKAGGVILDDTAAGLPANFLGVPATVGNPVYRKETVDAFELGAKLDWLNNSARTNLSFFYDDIKDLQVAEFIGLRFTVLNAPSAKVYGAELEQIFKLSNALTLTAAGTYLPKADFGTSPLLGAPLSGRRFATSPKLAGQVALDGVFPVTADFAITSRLQALYSGEVFTNTSTNDKQDAVTLVNANLGLKSLTNHWGLEGWIQNLTDKHYAAQHFQTPLQSGSVGAYVGAPRTYGVSVRGSF